MDRLLITEDGYHVVTPAEVYAPEARDIPPRSWIVCDNGHRICFTRDGLRVGERINTWHERLSRWHQPEPAVGSHCSYECDVCGASWKPPFKYEADR